MSDLIVIRCPGHMTSAGERQPEVVTAERVDGVWELRFPYGDETQPLGPDSRPLLGIAAFVQGAPVDVARRRVPLTCPGCRQRVVARDLPALRAALDLLASAGMTKAHLSQVRRALTAVNAAGRSSEL